MCELSSSSPEVKLSQSPVRTEALGSTEGKLRGHDAARHFSARSLGRPWKWEERWRSKIHHSLKPTARLDSNFGLPLLQESPMKRRKGRAKGGAEVVVPEVCVRHCETIQNGWAGSLSGVVPAGTRNSRAASARAMLGNWTVECRAELRAVGTSSIPVASASSKFACAPGSGSSFCVLNCTCLRPHAGKAREYLKMHLRSQRGTDVQHVWSRQTPPEKSLHKSFCLVMRLRPPDGSLVSSLEFRLLCNLVCCRVPTRC